jgi:hypothetical protein
VASHSYSTSDGNESPEPTSSVPEIDSRTWTRFPSRLHTICYTEKGPNDDPLPCRVGNISAAGINVVLKRAVEAGTPLTLQLPGLVEGFEASMLTHVNNVRLLNNGEWSLGCTFALELDDDTLLGFGIRRMEPLSIDQRRWKRFTVAVPVHFSALADDSIQGSARLTDLSAAGTGMQLDLPLRVGTTLNVGIGEAGKPSSFNILACVVRVTSHYSNHWRAGCTFVRELTEQELQGVV